MNIHVDLYIHAVHRLAVSPRKTNNKSFYFGNYQHKYIGFFFMSFEGTTFFVIKDHGVTVYVFLFWWMWTTAPCEVMYCPFGAECVVDGSTASCQCIERCYGVKPELVCGSNGEEYENECLLHKASCSTQKRIAVVAKGPCGKMHSVDSYATCQKCWFSHGFWKERRMILVQVLARSAHRVSDRKHWKPLQTF